MIGSFFGKHRFLSNFWPVNLAFEGLIYQSVEHAYQASKTEDKELREKISKMTPGEAKKFGKTIHITEEWHRKRTSIMKLLVKNKFFGDEELTELLLETGDEQLIEGNNWGDEFWGQYHGKGLNYLGRILMEVRSGIRKVKGIK